MNTIDIFKQISVQDLRDLDRDKCATLLGDQFQQFDGFCEAVISRCEEDPIWENQIASMSCTINEEGSAVFTTTLRDGSKNDVHFDKPEDIKVNEEYTISVTPMIPVNALEERIAARDEEAARAKESKKKSSRSSKRTGAMGI